MHAADVAKRAAELVGGDREAQHGTKLMNFTKIAAMWNAYLGIRRDPNAALDAEDVGYMMVLLKTARTQHGAYNPDDNIDMTGYAACAAEVAEILAKQRKPVDKYRVDDYEARVNPPKDQK